MTLSSILCLILLTTASASKIYSSGGDVDALDAPKTGLKQVSVSKTPLKLGVSDKASLEPSAYAKAIGKAIKELSRKDDDESTTEAASTEAPSTSHESFFAAIADDESTTEAPASEESTTEAPTSEAPSTSYEPSFAAVANDAKKASLAKKARLTRVKEVPGKLCSVFYSTKEIKQESDDLAMEDCLMTCGLEAPGSSGAVTLNRGAVAPYCSCSTHEACETFIDCPHCKTFLVEKESKRMASAPEETVVKPVFKKEEIANSKAATAAKAKLARKADSSLTVREVAGKICSVFYKTKNIAQEADVLEQDDCRSFCGLDEAGHVGAFTLHRGTVTPYCSCSTHESCTKYVECKDCKTFLVESKSDGAAEPSAVMVTADDANEAPVKLSEKEPTPVPEVSGVQTVSTALQGSSSSSEVNASFLKKEAAAALNSKPPVATLEVEHSKSTSNEARSSGARFLKLFSAFFPGNIL